MISALLFTSALMLNLTTSTSSSLNVKNSIKVKVNSDDAVVVREQIRTENKEKVEEHTKLMIKSRGELLTDLEVIKDTNKQQVVERIYTNQNNLNEHFVEKYNKTLKRLSEILTKVEQNGADPALVADAKNAIATAQTAVDAQSTKVYEFNITSENNLGQTISAVISKLRTDLTSVHKLILEAKTSVMDAYRSSLN